MKNANVNYKWLLEEAWNFLRVSTGFETAEKIKKFSKSFHIFSKFFSAVFLQKTTNKNLKNYEDYLKYSQSTYVLNFIKISVCSPFWNFLIFFFKKYKFKFI